MAEAAGKYFHTPLVTYLGIMMLLPLITVSIHLLVEHTSHQSRAAILGEAALLVVQNLFCLYDYPTAENEFRRSQIIVNNNTMDG